MAWELFDNIKGPKGEKGDPGTISSVSVAALEPSQPATAVLTGTTDVHLALGIPKGQKGDRGPAGAASSASAEAVAAEANPEVILSNPGGGDLVHAHFKIPRGLPGSNALPTAEAIGSNLASPDSPARAGFETGLTQVVQDPSSGLSVEIDGRIADAVAPVASGLAAKADIVSGKVPDTQLGAATTATSGTIPKRTTSGRLPGIGTPTANDEATPKAYVDTKVTDAVTPVSAQVTAMQGVMVTSDDTLFTANIAGVAAGANVVTSATGGHYSPLFVAPFPIRIVSAQVLFFQTQTTATSTNYANITLRRLRDGSGVQIVEKSTFADQPVAQKAWSFDGATWNESNRVLQAGDALAFGASIAGTYDVKYPIAVTVRYVRV